MRNARMNMNGSQSARASKVRALSMPMGAISVLLFCASAQVAAGVCEAEFKAAKWDFPPTISLEQLVVKRLAGGQLFHPSSPRGNVTVDSVYPDVATNVLALEEWASSIELFLKAQHQSGMYAQYGASTEADLCIVRARAAELKRPKRAYQ